MLKETYPYYLANEAVYANTDLEVTDKFSGKVATRVALADAKAIDAAIAAAVDAAKPMREMLQQYLSADPLREVDLRGHVVPRRGG